MGCKKRDAADQALSVCACVGRYDETSSTAGQAPWLEGLFGGAQQSIHMAAKRLNAYIAAKVRTVLHTIANFSTVAETSALQSKIISLCSYLPRKCFM